MFGRRSKLAHFPFGISFLSKFNAENIHLLLGLAALSLWYFQISRWQPSFSWGRGMIKKDKFNIVFIPKMAVGLHRDFKCIVNV